MNSNDEKTMISAVSHFFENSRAQTLSGALSAASAARDAFSRQIADQLELPLNNYLASREQQTFSDKASLTRDLEEQLLKLGLVIRHPDNGDPTALAVVRTRDGIGAYVFANGDEFDDHTKLTQMDTVPRLKFVPMSDELRGVRKALKRIACRPDILLR